MKLEAAEDRTIDEEVQRRLVGLSPAKRALLENRLKERGLTLEGATGSRREFPLSFPQQRIWILEEVEGSLSAYNLCLAWRILGELNVEALRRALEIVVETHEPLRTTLHNREGEGCQIVEPARRFELPVYELCDVPANLRETEWKRRAGEETELRFDLSCDLLLRAVLFRFSKRENILVVVPHHSSFDGWSQGILCRELQSLYGALVRGEPCGPQTFSARYVDFAIWQRQRISGSHLERLRAYWRTKLANLSPLELPADHPRPQRLSYRGERHNFELPADLARRVQSVCNSAGVTMQMALLAAFQILLSRYCNTEDIAVGIPSGARPAPEFESLIGCFINILVLRSKLAGNQSFVELLGEVRQTSLEALDYQDLPFDMVVEELRPERQINRNPLVSVMFQHWGGHQEDLSLDGVEVSSVPDPARHTQVDLTMHLVAGETILGTIEYFTDLFEASTIERIAAHYQTLLDRLSANPCTPIGRVAMLTEAESAQIVVGWNATRANYPRGSGIHELFRQQVERSPDAVAVVFGGNELTYRELDEQSEDLAHYLCALGVHERATVAICVEPSPEMIIGLLATLKAGAAYVPIDPKYPEERTLFMLAETEAAVVLTRNALAERFSAANLRAVCLDGQREAIDRAVELPRGVGGDDLAYVLFTSGSTGKPKGVCVPHRAVNRLVINSDYVQLDASDVVAQLSNCCFDAATFEIWGALLNGSRLVGIDLEHLLSPQSFSAELAKHQVTTLFVTTALFNGLAHECPDIFRDVGNVLFGGEECDPSAVGKVLKEGPPRRLLHVYGPTETTTFASWYLIGHDQDSSGRIPIGRPIANTQIYILDSHLKPTPIGVPGELWIGGEGVASGYLNRPKLTAQRFIESPFVSGQRLYRTGDRGRFLSDGNIDFLGRLDQQVKIRGFRIELGEVECVLRQHPGVTATVATVREDTTDKQLVAYVVPACSEPAPNIVELREYLRRKLPDYMVPSAFVLLEKLPLTPNGKVDRCALPAPEPPLDAYRAPSTPHEQILCAIYAELLGLERVGIDENFFSLGGHSLLAMRLVNRVQSTFGVELSVRTVFEAPTVGQLVARLCETRKASAPPLVRQERPQRLPLSFAQQRLWFLDRLEGSSSEYNMAEAVRLRGKLSVPALERAVKTLVERHESLRTRFGEIDGEPFQVVEPACHIALELEDLSELDNAIGEETANAALCREKQNTFDLSCGPLLRIKLFRLGEHDHILLWTCHHIISDGWSVTIFNREIAVLYGAFCEDRQNPLSPLPIQYADYGLWQRSQFRSENSQALLAYWREQLADAPRLKLPLDRPRPARQTNSGARCSVSLSRDLTSGLKVLSREENCTLFMGFLAAFKLLLSRYSGQEDISLGIPAVNRNRVEIEGLIGCFLNTLVLRTNLSGKISFRELMGRVRKVTLGAYAHQDLPFEKLVEELQPERSLNYSPLFQVFLNFISIEEEPFILPGLEAERIELESIKAKFDISLYAYEREEGLFLDLVYNTVLFEAATAERMLSRFRVLLEAIVVNPDQHIGALPLLTPEDQKTYTASDNRVRPMNPHVHFPLEAVEQSIGARFEEQVRKNPRQIAVRTLTHVWTYVELDRRANVIAREILRICPEGEDRISLLFGHDAPMVAAILGALKAGKTYVPLSPSHPRQRLERILLDSQPRMLLADAANGALGRELAVGAMELLLIEDLGDEGDAVRVIVPPERLAYLLYTSGSTGEPKGVAQNHRNVLHHIRNYTNSLHISSCDRLVMLASYGFDAAVMDIFGALLNGATLLPFDIRNQDIEALGEWMVAEDATIYHSTPTVFRHFFRALPKNRSLPQLRLVVMGGEAVHSQDFELFRQRLPDGCILVNGFGQTECSFSLQYFADSKMEFANCSIPIGYPLDETEVFLLDAEGHPGQIFGEIAIRSPYLSEGYWRRPELTALVFKDDRREGKLRTYRTGDLGRLRVDGTIEFVGRKDFQTKIRGNRVELGEIEAVLRQHSQIQSAAVVARHSSEDEQELVAYVVLKEVGSVSGGQLRGFLAKSLPDYMVPSAFVTLDKLPLTANGKINRKALPLPECECSRQDYVPPRTPFERTLADIWSEVLGVETIGVHDDFFEQGGHSLIATRLVSQMRKSFDVEIPIRAVFEKRTIENLAFYIAELQAGEAAPDEIEKLLAELE